MRLVCKHCGESFDHKGARGRTPSFCSDTCRQRSYRRSRAGVGELAETALGWCRADGKRPIMVDGRPASSTNSDTWASFEAVQSGAGDGFGVMLGGGVGCFDLDHCLQGGRVAGWAREVIEAIPYRVVFVERSLSGEGLHVFVEAPEQPGSRQGGVEAYFRDRFIRTTLTPFSIL